MNWKWLTISLVLAVWEGEGLITSTTYGRRSSLCRYPSNNNNNNNNDHGGHEHLHHLYNDSHQQPTRTTTRRRRRNMIPPIVLESRVDEDTTTEEAEKRTTTHGNPLRKARGTTTTMTMGSPAQIEREIITLGRQGRIEQALQIYRSLHPPTVRQMNAMIDACSRSRPVRLDLAFDILHDAAPCREGVGKGKARGVPLPNVYTFGSLMSVCARAGSVQHALRLLQTMERNYAVTPNAVVYNTAVSACARANPPQFDVALKLLQEARDRGLRLSVVGYNAAIAAAAQAGNWKGAVDLLNQMEQAQQGPKTATLDDDITAAVIPRPDAVSYGTVLSAFERGGEWQRILEFADYLQSVGQPLDGLAITSVLHACQSLGMADEAVRYLNLMKQSVSFSPHRQTAGWDMAGGRTPLDGPDAVAYLLAVSACARGGDWIQGIELLNEYCSNKAIRRKHPEVDINIFTAAITGCEYAGRWEEAFLLLERMRKANVQVTDVAIAAVIGSCATACARLQQDAESSSKDGSDLEPKQKALRLLTVMTKDKSVMAPTPLVYNAAIRTCAEAHDLKGAFNLFEAMQSDSNLQPNVVTFGSLMTACERVGNIDGMVTVFNLLKKSDCKANDVIYGAAISCCRKAGGQEQRAFLLLQKLIKEGLQPNVATVNTVLMAQAEARNTANLARIYKLIRPPTSVAAAFQTPTTGNRLLIKPNRQTFSIIIRGFAERKLAQEAEAVLLDMRENGFPQPDVDLYTLVVSAYERAGKPLQALRLMESMNTQGYAFYEDKVLNAAFKRLLNMANMVGQSLSSSPKTENKQKLHTAILLPNDNDYDHTMEEEDEEEEERNNDDSYPC